MANVTAPNFALAASNDTRSALHKLSRAMKAAGWVTLSSSDGTTKDTTGGYTADKWNGTIGNGGTGAVASVTTVVGGVATLTGLTGFSTTTAGQRWITITGAASGGNNGTFKILSFISATSVTIRNTAAVASDANNGAISWTERIPLSDTYTIGASAWINMQGPSTLKITISTIAQDGYQVNVLGSNQTGTVARITAINSGLVTVSGLTNMTIGSSANVIVITGAASSANNGSFTIVKQLDPNTVLIANPSGVAPDTNNGSINWQERIGVNGIRGENVTQTTTGAQGEVVGINFDFLTGTGYLVVFPRNNGSGGGPFGWDGTNTITGATSGAVWTPTATPTEFIREIVMWAPTAITTTISAGSNGASLPQATINAVNPQAAGFPTAGIMFVVTSGGTQTVTYTGTTTTTFTGCSGGSGTMSTGNAVTASIGTLTGYMQCINNSTENASRFSVLATSAGATATIAPGGGGTNNTFPIPGSYVWVGTGGAQTPARFGMITTTGLMTNAQIMCADSTFDIGRSADGSFTCAIGVPTDAGSYLGFTFTRLDDQEDGDIDPYIFYNPSADTLYAPVRTALTTNYTGGATTGRSFNAGSGTLAGTTLTNSTSSCNLSAFRGWRGRGTSNDSFQNYQVGLLVNGSGAYSATNGTGAACMTQNTTDIEVNTTATVNTIVNTNSVFIGEPVWVVSAQAQARSMKGSCRWLRCVMGGTGTDTLGAGSGVGFWYQLCTGSTTFFPFVSGPWDGSTTPVK